MLRVPSLPAAVLTALLLAALPVGADQNDPQLDALFEALAQATDAELVRRLENRIWALWYQHPDSNARGLLDAGERLMNAGFQGDALRVFNTLVTQHPDFAEAWNRRATLHYLMGNYDASIADIERTLQLEPRHFGALSGLGLVYLQQDNLAAAREAFERLLSIHPNSPAARQNLDNVLEALRARFI